MTTIAFIMARGGSKGLPRKNLRLLAGKPLLVHALEAAQAATLVDRVIVSTEDAEIAEVARQYGADVIERPAELAADDSPEWLSWQHAIRAMGQREERGGPPVDLFVCVPCTAPLRLPSDIDGAIRALQAGDADAVLTVTEARRNPYYNQVVLDGVGHARTVIAYSEPIHRRQTAPLLYDCTTVCYAARPEFVLRAKSLWEGQVGAVVVPPERAIDIDTELDLRVAEVLIQEREKGEVAW
jgi:N-acylneuraminate cytidylyltransferase